MSRRLKNILAILILLVTATAFIYYFKTHPAVGHELSEISPVTLILLFGLYICFIGSVALILLATVRLCNIHLTVKDGVLLTMWSSIINFFGPLQSGPAFRGVYLKRVHKLPLRQYGLATLIYYGFYAVFSGLCLLSGVMAWQLLLVLIALGILATIVLLRSPLGLAQRIRKLPLRHAYKLGLASLLQALITIGIYYFELTSINPAITLHQAVIYSGAANFALFVALTPGAIGFREAFLIFSERLHHIGQTTIVTANVIDRAVYVALLGALFIVAIAFHVQEKMVTKAAAKPSL